MTLIHRYSYLISLEIAAGYRKLRSFQETQVNLNGLLDKPDITYPQRNSLHQQRLKYVKNLIIGHVNINLIRNKFLDFKELVLVIQISVNFGD